MKHLIWKYVVETCPVINHSSSEPSIPLPEEKDHGMWGWWGCCGVRRDAKAKTSLCAHCRQCLVPSCKGAVTPREGGVSRGCRTAGQQKFKHPRGVSAQPCMSWVDLEESLWSWLERRLHLALSHFQGSQERDKVYNHLDPLSPLKRGK